MTYDAQDHLRWLFDLPAFRLVHGDLHATGLVERSRSLAWREYGPMQLPTHAARRATERYIPTLRRIAGCLPPTLRNDHEDFAAIVVLHSVDRLPALLDALELAPGYRLRDAGRVNRLQSVCERRLRRDGAIPQADLDASRRALKAINPPRAFLRITADQLEAQTLAALCATSLARGSYVDAPSAVGRPVFQTVWQHAVGPHG